MKPNVIDSAVQSLKKIETELTTLARAEAIKAGWPKDLAGSLRVVVGRDEISIQYPEASAEAIEDLEYGTRTSNPKPVFRRFMNKHGNRVSRVIEDWTNKTLEELGEFL